MAATIIALGTVLGAISSSQAMPVSDNANFFKRQGTTAVTPSWVSNNDGNVVFVFSDQTISFGSVQPSDVAGQLGSECYDAGVCNNSPWTMNGSVPASGGGGNEIVVTVNSEGTYPEWSHNGLVAAFQAAVGAIQQSTEVTYNRKSRYCRDGMSTGGESQKR